LQCLTGRSQTRYVQRLSPISTEQEGKYFSSSQQIGTCMTGPTAHVPPNRYFLGLLHKDFSTAYVVQLGAGIGQAVRLVTGWTTEESESR
jgi:hypothetical protein